MHAVEFTPSLVLFSIQGFFKKKYGIHVALLPPIGAASVPSLVPLLKRRNGGGTAPVGQNPSPIVFAGITANPGLALHWIHHTSLPPFEPCRSEDSFKQYFSEMPWLAVPYADEARRSRLNRLYGIQGMPKNTLLLHASCPSSWRLGCFQSLICSFLNIGFLRDLD